MDYLYRFRIIVFALYILYIHFYINDVKNDKEGLLISKGANVNVGNSANHPILRIETKRGHAEIVDMLRKYGAKK